MSAVSDCPSPTTASACAAAIHETHTGLVVLFGDRAYKLKKPVVTDFLDFSSVEAREYVCRRELALNRRIAPASYLGIAHLVGSPDSADEPIIVMRRHPAARCLAALVTEDAPVNAELDAIAERLADFHRTADRGHRVDTCATAEAVEARWRENLAELRGYTPDVLPPAGVAELAGLFLDFVATRRDIFGQRIDGRRIVDGHGDLQAADIYCLEEGPALLDCLEFDDDLRYVDGFDDAAFLAMDLEFLGRRDLGEYFLDQYRRRISDDAPPALVHFYIGYRAMVRAKVDCIRVAQGHPEAGADARRHLTIALEHLRMARVRLIIVGGGPGTGKTTLSRRLADEIGAQVLSTDDIRTELRDRGRIAGRPGTLQSGLYTRENVDRVYDEVCRRTQQLLAAGHTVILDGTWRDARHRAAVRTIAEDLTVPVLEFVCTTSLEEARSRIARRGPTSSDATAELAEPLTPDLDDWVEAHRVDTGRPLQMSVAEARRICCTGI
ncbi:AAA family ATPase [Mycolicibacterium sp. 22603]|uniref:bifunctional aminoglycoside phosphotransferase/ATP-binding protein n=1 Tax=Mycolicibacterium sp. 22603 TaxID=3453950 RepID=UPI003F86D5EF